MKLQRRVFTFAVVIILVTTAISMGNIRNAKSNQQEKTGSASLTDNYYTGDTLYFGVSNGYGEIMPFQYPIGNEHLMLGSEVSGYTISYLSGGSPYTAVAAYEDRMNFAEGSLEEYITPDLITIRTANQTNNGVISIDQTFTFPTHNKFVIIDAQITNNSYDAIQDVYYKVYADWDVDNEYDDDNWDYDAARNMVYAYNEHYCTVCPIYPFPDIIDIDGWDDYDTRTTVQNYPPGYYESFDGLELMHYNLGDMSPGQTYHVMVTYASGDDLADLQNEVDTAISMLIGFGSVEGYVYDSNMNPLEDAIVRDDSFGAPDTTGSDGYYYLEEVLTGNRNIIASCYTYVDNIIQVFVEEGLTATQDFVLEDFLYPEIWVSPDSFSFTMSPGDSTTEYLTIGNAGEGVMDFIIDDVNPAIIESRRESRNPSNTFDLVDDLEGPGNYNTIETLPPLSLYDNTDEIFEETFGSWSSTWTGDDRLRGNIFHVDSTVFLIEHRLYISIPVSTNLDFVVYRSPVSGSTFDLVHQVSTISGTGEGWYSSGSIEYLLEAGYYYLIAACWELEATYGRGGSTPVPTTFGSLESYGIEDECYPPPPSITVSTGSAPYYQTIVTSTGPDWLLYEPTVGSVAPGSSEDIEIKINTVDVEPGEYSRWLVVASNDTLNPEIIVPIQLTVLPSTALNISLTPLGTPIVIPETGGSFDFNIAVINPDPLPTVTDMWTSIVLPNAGVVEPIILVQEFNVPGYWMGERERTQEVSANAPGGIYTYFARLGDYPNTVTSIDSFTFEKLGLDRIWDDWTLDDWLCSGEDFESLIEGAEQQIPSVFGLTGAYPNPFNPVTTISFVLPEKSLVSMKIYNIHGQLVSTLIDGMRDAGIHDVSFDVSQLPSGIYFAHLKSGEFQQTQKLLLVK